MQFKKWDQENQTEKKLKEKKIRPCDVQLKDSQ